MIISIHQPNYLPWAGFFHKILHSDIFVIFDDVQLPRGKDFVIRNRIKTQSGAKWLSVPVKEKSSLKLIQDVEINNDLKWYEKHWNSIQNNYSKTMFFSKYQNQFHEVWKKKWNFLVDLNLEIIYLIMNILEIKTKVVRSSELNIKSTGTDKILGILEKLNADEYFTGWGPGSRRYIDGKEDLFEKKGIKIKKQEFICTEYYQLFGTFIPDLTICDMLFNIGSEQTRKKLYQ